MSSDMGTEKISTHLETLQADPDTFGEMKLVDMGSNDSSVQDMSASDMNQESMPSMSCNLDLLKVETSVSGPMSHELEPEVISLQSCISSDSQSLMPQSQTPTSLNIEPQSVSLQFSVSSDSQSVMPQSQPPVSLNVEPQSVSLQSSVSSDSQSVMPQSRPPGAYLYFVEKLAAACRSPRSFQLTGKRKFPPESTSGSASEKLDVPNKRVVSVHHRPWLEQFYSASIGPINVPPATLSPKTEHQPMLGKKVRQREPASQKTGRQVINKKQTGSSQGSTKTQNDAYDSLRSKMKESLAAALALVQEPQESPKENKNSETQEANVSVAESNEPASACGISVPVAESIMPALSTRDESSGAKDSNGSSLLQETSNDTKMNYVNQSDVQKTQFDEVFPCDDVPFSDSIFSNDELLQGNGLSWALEPVSDFGEIKACEEKPFQDPEILASKIELELFKLFGGVNKKYKEKGRSLLFNLKDKNNPELRESVMSGKISPERLCSMTAEELASKELSEWRQAKAEKMAEMVVLRDADIDVSRLVRKTHKGEYQVEIDPVDSGTVDVSAGIISRSRPRARAKSEKSSNSAKSTVKNNESNGKDTESDCTVTLPTTEEIDPMQGLSMDDEMKDVGFLPPIVSLDEFMESLNSEPPFGSPQHGDAVKEEATTSEKDDSKVGSPSKSPKEPCENISPKTELEKTSVTSPKPDTSVKLDVDVSEPKEAPLVDRIWDGILQLSVSSVISVNGIFKSGERAKTSEWPTLLEVKGRVRLSAFGKFVQELPLSRSRVLMVMNVVCKDGISQSQRDSLFEVAKSYVADQRVGYAEPTSGVELYLCPPRGETLDLLSKIISKEHMDEVKSSDDFGLIGLVVWRRAVVASPGSRHKSGLSGFKRQHSSTGTKSSVLAAEKKRASSVNVMNQPPVIVAAAAAESIGNRGLGGFDAKDGDEDDVPPGFGPVAAKDDDDLPEYNFNSSSGPVASSPRPPPQSRSMDQVRELIFKYGNSVASGSKRPWNNDDDEDDIPEWQPQASGHQIQLPPPPDFRSKLDPRLHSGTLARPPAQRPDAGSPGEWRTNQNAARNQHYGTHKNRGF